MMLMAPAMEEEGRRRLKQEEELPEGMDPSEGLMAPATEEGGEGMGRKLRQVRACLLMSPN